MLEGLQRLLDLQVLDEELIALQEEQGAVPERRTRIAEARAACDERLASSQETLKAAEADQRSAETDLQDREAEVRRLEGQTSQVKSNDAYTALLSEIDHAREAISACETRILEDMETIETARAELSEAEGVVAEERGRLSQEEQTLDAREKELEGGVAELERRRAGMVGEIPAELMTRYIRITARRRPALVTISKELCAGCRVDIPAQDYIEILRAEKIVSCGNCNRILVHEEKLAAIQAS